MEPTVDNRFRSFFRLIPVTRHDHIATGQYLSVFVYACLNPDRGRTCCTENNRAICRRQIIHLGSWSIDSQYRRSLGEPINLIELPAQFSLDSFNGSRWWWCTRNNNSNCILSRNLPLPRCCAIKDCICDCGGTTHQRDSVAFNSSKNLGTIHLAQNNVLSTHRCHRVHHAPAIAMKLRQCVQIHITVIHSHVPTKRCSI